MDQNTPTSHVTEVSAARRECWNCTAPVPAAAETLEVDVTHRGDRSSALAADLPKVRELRFFCTTCSAQRTAAARRAS